MPSITSLLNSLHTTHPHLTFEQGDDFHWDYNQQTIYYPAPTSDSSWPAHLLHELAHAKLQHHSYTRDIELIRLEREAWTYARTTLAVIYEIQIDTEVIESAMDSYRDWLHSRSTCPACHATGYEVKKHTYTCMACSEQWNVNEARLCNLKRYRIKK